MVYYIASPTYQQVIERSLRTTDSFLVGKEVEREMYLHKYIKENITKLDKLEHIIIDLNIAQDTEVEIMSALETLRIMANKTKIILLATNYVSGEKLLIDCLNAGIYDIIISNDYNVILEELQYCIKEGKQYKDILRLRSAEEKDLKISENQEQKNIATKIMIGMVGAQGRIGVTHNSIVLANHLRRLGYMVALVEYNPSNDYEHIREEFDENIFDDLYFSMNGIDYYPNVDVEILSTVISKYYNFIIIDFGTYKNCDWITFNKCNKNIVVMGSKPWEVQNASGVFEKAGQAVDNYHYFFNFTREDVRTDVKKSMEELEHVHFFEYTKNPFKGGDFPDVDSLLKEYLPINGEHKRKGFSKFFKRGNKL